MSYEDFLKKWNELDHTATMSDDSRVWYSYEVEKLALLKMARENNWEVPTC